MGNPNTERKKRSLNKNPEKKREHKRRYRQNRKARIAAMTPEERANLKMRLGIQRTSRLRQLLQQLSEAQNHRCCYCGHETWLEGVECSVKREKWNMATKEHITPRSRGGTLGKYNLAMACSSCNNARGNMDYEDFIALITKEPKKAKPLKQQAPKEDREERAEARQAAFAYWTIFYLLQLTEEQRQTINGWVKEYEETVVPSGRETFKNRRERKEKKGCTLTKIRYRVRQTNIYDAIAFDL